MALVFSELDNCNTDSHFKSSHSPWNFLSLSNLEHNDIQFNYTIYWEKTIYSQFGIYQHNLACLKVSLPWINIYTSLEIFTNHRYVGFFEMLHAFLL